jgi:hypothetical protein
MRELVGAAKLREGQESTSEMLVKTYNTAMSQAANTVVEKWAGGAPPPVPEAHLVVAEVVRGDVVVGFNVYLVWGEVRSLGGRMPREEE